MGIIYITMLFILIYLLYPYWLKKQKIVTFDEVPDVEADNISLIFLSRNHAYGLKEKISFLLGEISGFKNAEIIVIDDASTDGTAEILQELIHSQLRIIIKESPRGVPDSMNLGVKLSAWENIVFCDQRQILEKGIISKLIAPLGYNQVGAVSSCISSCDKSEKFYVLREHETNIKKLEGRTGNLMGVYGPLYALKKKYYHPIPDNIILDDLYLTLHILKDKQVVFQNDCKIYDDNFELLYSYKRTKRYLAGFIQILNERKLLSQLSGEQKFMLFWHKYFRIPIPLLIASSYIFLGLKSLHSHLYFSGYFGASVLAAFLFIPIDLKFCRQIRSMLRFVCFYSMASIELFIKASIFKQNIYEK
jgi:poly-beta-1,6-N-acetyl-D-glucosamine synthase